MAKGKLERVIFRKIGGRIIPIKISNVADKIAEASDYGFNKFRKIQANTPSGPVGTLNLRIPKKGNHAEVINVQVEKAFRKKGISKNLFTRASDFVSRIGKKFLRTYDLQHPAQVKIRSQQGRYKAGKRGKNRTKFIADQFGPYGEQSKIVKSQAAIDYLKNNKTGRQIKASTMIKKRKK